MEKICRNCFYFPCTKPQCQLGEKACNDYESLIEAESKKLEENRNE